MATTATPSRFPAVPGSLDRLAGMPGRALNSTGKVAVFAVEAIKETGHALRYYRKEIVRLIAETGMGAGAMAVVGGTVAIVGFITLSAGSLIAIQGFASLGNIGVEAFTGFLANQHITDRLDVWSGMSLRSPEKPLNISARRTCRSILAELRASTNAFQSASSA